MLQVFDVHQVAKFSKPSAEAHTFFVIVFFNYLEKSEYSHITYVHSACTLLFGIVSMTIYYCYSHITQAILFPVPQYTALCNYAL